MARAIITPTLARDLITRQVQQTIGAVERFSKGLRQQKTNG